MRSAGFGAVIQHYLDRVLRFSPDNPRIGNVGEPVAIVAGKIVGWGYGVFIGVMHIFVTHSGAELAHTGYEAAVRSKTGNIVLFYGRLGCRNIDTFHLIIVRAA